MIGRLTGLVTAPDTESCIIDVNGVGYVVHASALTLSQLPQPPEKAVVLVETIVREDAIQLFGFASPEEQSWFRLLTTVQGVGSRVALSILSVCHPQNLPSIIAGQDKAQLTRANGVGPRLAARILAELGEKAATLPRSVAAGGMVKQSVSPTLESDAMRALEGLGFRRSEVWDVLTRVLAENNGAALDKVLGLVLKEMGR